MASTFSRKLSANISTTATSVGGYSPATGGAIVLGLTVSNTTISTRTVNIILKTAIKKTYIAKGVPIPTKGSIVPIGGPQKIILQVGDSVQVETTSGYGVDAVMTVMETDNVGLTEDGPTGGFYEVVTETNLTLPSGVTQDTGNYVFGTSSLAFNSSATGGLNFDSTAFNYDVSGFITVECWYRTTVPNSQETLNLPVFMVNSSTNQMLGMRQYNGTIAAIGSDTNGGSAAGTNPRTPGTIPSFNWRHLGMTFNASGAGWYFCNGLVSQNEGTFFNQANKNRIMIGGSSNFGGFPYYVRNCNVDDIRISYGKRYGGAAFDSISYTVPTSRLTVDANTIALFQSR